MALTTLDTQYNPKEIEPRWLKFWETERLAHAEPDDNAETYSIVIPPPNVTGTLHLGHASMLAIEDIMIRFHRMLGKKALWLPGTDHAGIATQNAVEKNLAEQGIRREDLGREE